jgi:hypothetical protein
MDAKFDIGGVFHVEAFESQEAFDRGDAPLWAKDFHNGNTTGGLNHLLNTEFVGGGQVATWYGGLIDNAGFSALASADTMASHAGWAESTAYSEGVRQTWGAGAAAGASITNGAAMTFTISGTPTIYGIFITSSNVKGGATGTLWATGAFGSPQLMANGQLLKVTYTLGAA